MLHRDVGLLLVKSRQLLDVHESLLMCATVICPMNKCVESQLHCFVITCYDFHVVRNPSAKYGYRNHA